MGEEFEDYAEGRGFGSLTSLSRILIKIGFFAKKRLSQKMLENAEKRVAT